MRILIVAADGARGAVTAVRALAHSGAHVGTASPSRGALAARSRASRWHDVVPWPQRSLDDFAEAVNGLVERRRYDIILAGGDDWLFALTAAQDRIDARVAHPSFTAVDQALDKLRVHACALEAGLATPHTELATHEAVSAWRGPAIVKSRRHWVAGMRDANVRIEAARCDDLASRRRQVDAVASRGGEPLLQEAVTGRLGAVSVVLHGSDPIVAAQQVAVTSYPTPVGITARGKTVDVDRPLLRGVSDMLAAMGWEGLAQVQFIEDEAGRRWIIDVNGRLYGSLALATAAGADLATAAVRLAAEPEAAGGPAVVARAGVRYQWLEGDLRRMLVSSPPRDWPREMLDTFRWALTSEHSLWRLDDPGPALRQTVDLLGRAIRKVTRT